MIECDVIYWWPLWAFWLAHRSEAERRSVSMTLFLLSSHNLLLLCKSPFPESEIRLTIALRFLIFPFLTVLKCNQKLNEQSIDWTTESPGNCCSNILKICSSFLVCCCCRQLAKPFSNLITGETVAKGLKHWPRPSATCARVNNFNSFRMNYSNFRAIWLFI